MKESTPTLLRAIGLTMVLVVTISAFMVAREQAELSRTRITANIKFDTTKPFKTLSEEEKHARGYQIIINNLSEQMGDLHFDMQKRNLMGAVNSSPILFFFGSSGTALITCSFFAEWLVKRQKEKSAAAEESQTLT